MTVRQATSEPLETNKYSSNYKNVKILLELKNRNKISRITFRRATFMREIAESSSHSLDYFVFRPKVHSHPEFGDQQEGG